MSHPNPARISPREARRRLQSEDDPLLLVCAYDDDSKFEDNPLDGAIALSEFRSRLPALSKKRALAFY